MIFNQKGFVVQQLQEVYEFSTPSQKLVTILPWYKVFCIWYQAFTVGDQELEWVPRVYSHSAKKQFDISWQYLWKATII